MRIENGRRLDEAATSEVLAAGGVQILASFGHVLRGECLIDRVGHCQLARPV